MDETKEAGPIFEQRQPSNQHPQVDCLFESRVQIQQYNYVKRFSSLFDDFFFYI